MNSDLLLNQINAPPGTIVYGRIVNAAGLFWNGTSMVSYVAGDIATYGVLATEISTSGVFNFTVPAIPAGYYTIYYFARAGATQSVSDSNIGQLPMFYWDGTQIITLNEVNDNVLNIISSLQGPGADQVTIDITAGGNPVANMKVWITTDAQGSNVVAGTVVTDSNGEYNFLLTYGVTYYLWGFEPGYNPVYGVEFVAAPTNSFTTTEASATTGILMTLTEAREYVISSVLSVSQGTYGDAKIDRAIQFAGKMFMEKTKVNLKRATITLAAGERFVDVQSQVPDFDYWRYARAQINHQGYIYRVLRSDYAKLQMCYTNNSQTGRPTRFAFQTNNRAILYPKPEQQYNMEITYAESFVDWVPGASGDSVTLNIPGDYVRTVLAYGAGTYLLYGEQYQNVYAQKGWAFFQEFMRDVIGKINIESDDNYNGPEEGTFGGWNPGA